MKLLDRYVAREFLFSYAVALLVVLSLRLLIDLFMFFDEFVEDETTGAIARIASYYGPQLLLYFRDFSGMTVLLAAVFALARMTRQNELTAVLASGVSLKRVIAPVVLLGVALNLLMVIDQELILPRVANKLVRRHDEMESLRKVPIFFLPDRNGALVYAHHYDHQERALHNMLVVFRRDGQMVGRLTADSADWDADQQRWMLTNGRRFGDNGIDVPTRTASQSAPQQYYESDLSADYLWLQRNSDSKTLMSSRDLSSLLQRDLKAAQKIDIISEKHFRFTDPIINMVMLLLGLPLLVSRERRSTKTAMFLSLAGAGGCFVATFACKLIVGSSVPVLSSPLWAAWAPIIIFVPVSVIALDELKT